MNTRVQFEKESGNLIYGGTYRLNNQRRSWCKFEQSIKESKQNEHSSQGRRLGGGFWVAVILAGLVWWCFWRTELGAVESSGTGMILTGYP